MGLKGKRGAAMVEFILLAPILMTILFGIIEFGVILFDKNIIANASREGARYGIIPQSNVYPTSTAISSYITSKYTTNLISLGTGATAPTITATSSVTPAVKGATLTVTVSYSYKCLVIHKLTTLTCPITLTGKTVMSYE